MNIENNTFFTCKDYYFHLFETRDGVIDADLKGWSAMQAITEKSLVEQDARWWIRELQEQVSCVEPNQLMYFLNKEHKFWQVIVGERIGWIATETWFLFIPFLPTSNVVR